MGYQIQLARETHATMDILTTIQQRSSELNLEFIVVGGLAINAHGYERVTSDIDILVRQEKRQVWKNLMESLGYKIFHEQVSFMQFHSTEGSVWPVDLMFVNRETFSKIFSESIEAKMKGMSFRVPRLQHLLTLKHHALKHTQEARLSNDLLDIVMLSEINGIDVSGKQVTELCNRYNIFNRKSSPLPQADCSKQAPPLTTDLELEFPDGTGFESKYVRVGLEAMIEICESRLELFNSHPGAQERRLRDKCNIEFVL